VLLPSHLLLSSYERSPRAHFSIPKIAEDGFRAREKIFAKGNQKILEYYYVARNCLERSLGDHLCDVLLMLVLMFSASSVTPTVAAKSHHFEAGPLKDLGLFAASIVTRMPWFLQPEAFPWEQDDGVVLQVSEMTNKIKHKGSMASCSASRDGFKTVVGVIPRNSDLSLRSVNELLKLCAELLFLTRDPAEFVAQVFRCHNSIWLERCSGSLGNEARLKGMEGAIP
jgi:hypothetical protein